MRLLRSKIFPIAATVLLMTLLNGQTNQKNHQVNHQTTPNLQLASYTNVKTNQPNPILGTTNVAIGGGGYVTGIYLHPKQRNLVYIKTDVGGFYRWNSSNQSWSPLTDHFPLAQLNFYGGEAIALDPNNPNTLYIAVGKYTGDWWQHKGTIFKSTNQGKTWSKLNLDLKMGGNEVQRWTGERLAINPFDSQTILFGSRKDGLWKSSNGGKTWGQVKLFPGKLKDNLGITIIAFNKDVRNEVYAVAYDDGIYQSNDAGVTWKKLSNSPTQTNRLVITHNQVLYVTHSLGVSKYSHGKWSNITPANNQTAFNAIAINPLNPDDVLVCAITEKALQIYHSLNGGNTWKIQNRQIISSVPWWSDYMLSNPSVAAIEFDPNVANRVWMTDWYGIWRTDNITSNQVIWKNYQRGHEEVVTFGLVSPPIGAPLISALSDVEGFYHKKLDAYPVKMLGGKDGKNSLFQDTYSIAYCETNPKRMVRVGGNRFNNTYGGATSDDGGKTWKSFPSFPEKIMPTRVAMSATDPNLFVVSASGGQALRTIDNGATWQKVSGLPDGFTGPWNWTQPLAADKVIGNTFYYYTNSKLYRSNNGGASFEVVSTSTPHASFFSLKTVPGVKGELWLSLDNKGLYRSTDAGKTFLPITAVKRAYLFSIGKAQNQSKIPTLYVYGKIANLGNGIFRSVDQGKSWKRIGDSTKTIGNDPNFMEASRQKFGLVFIGTNGRGIYYGT
jgi:xyloglucan-specific exo-beta-1,4-glucanase